MINIITAFDNNNVIGYNNKLLCKLPNDLRYFKKVTNFNPVIMGLNTYLSIGKPLKNRINIVLTKKYLYYRDLYKKNIYFCGSIYDALDISYTYGTNIFVIGGEKVYNQFIHMSSYLYITRIHYNFEYGDSFFPKINYNDWIILNNSFHHKDENHLYDYEFIKYQRIRK